MVSTFRRLWAGDVPLPRAFWEFSVLYGLALNLAATVAAMSVAAAGGGTAAFLALFLLPTPYNLLTLVAVWRSAPRHAGSRLWAELARPAALLWTLLLTFA